jgi:hypothetical protein
MKAAPLAHGTSHLRWVELRRMLVVTVSQRLHVFADLPNTIGSSVGFQGWKQTGSNKSLNQPNSRRGEMHIGGEELF